MKSTGPSFDCTTIQMDHACTRVDVRHGRAAPGCLNRSRRYKIPFWDTFLLSISKESVGCAFIWVLSGPTIPGKCSEEFNKASCLVFFPLEIYSSMAPGLVTPGVPSSMLPGHVKSALYLRDGCRRFCGNRLPNRGARPGNAPSPIRPSLASQNVAVRAAASVGAPAQDEGVYVSIDNAQDSDFTVVTISGFNRPGLLTSISGTFRDLGLDVGKVGLHTMNILLSHGLSAAWNFCILGRSICSLSHRYCC